MKCTINYRGGRPQVFTKTGKLSPLWKELSNYASPNEAVKIYLYTQSPAFEVWYEDGPRNEDGEPIIKMIDGKPFFVNDISVKYSADINAMSIFSQRVADIAGPEPGAALSVQDGEVYGSYLDASRKIKAMPTKKDFYPRYWSPRNNTPELVLKSVYARFGAEKSDALSQLTSRVYGEYSRRSQEGFDRAFDELHIHNVENISRDREQLRSALTRMEYEGILEADPFYQSEEPYQVNKLALKQGFTVDDTFEAMLINTNKAVFSEFKRLKRLGPEKLKELGIKEDASVYDILEVVADKEFVKLYKTIPDAVLEDIPIKSLEAAAAYYEDLGENGNDQAAMVAERLRTAIAQPSVREDMIAAKRTEQESQLIQWWNYLNTNDRYTNAFKLLMFMNVIKSNIAIEGNNYKVINRSKTTINPITTFNAAGIAILYDSKTELKDNNILFEYDSAIQKLVKTKSKEHSKNIYAKTDRGTWYKYNKGEGKMLSERSAGTSWCVASTYTANNYLNTGPFFVFEYNNPLTVNNDKIGVSIDERRKTINEARGNQPGQGLHNESLAILEEFYDRPEIEAMTSSVKELRELKKKVIAVMKEGTPINSDDLAKLETLIQDRWGSDWDFLKKVREQFLIERGYDDTDATFLISGNVQNNLNTRPYRFYYVVLGDITVTANYVEIRDPDNLGVNNSGIYKNESNEPITISIILNSDVRKILLKLNPGESITGEDMYKYARVSEPANIPYDVRIGVSYTGFNGLNLDDTIEDLESIIRDTPANILENNVKTVLANLKSVAKAIDKVENKFLKENLVINPQLGPEGIAGMFSIRMKDHKEHMADYDDYIDINLIKEDLGPNFPITIYGTNNIVITAANAIDRIDDIFTPNTMFESMTINTRNDGNETREVMKELNKRADRINKSKVEVIRITGPYISEKGIGYDDYESNKRYHGLPIFDNEVSAVQFTYFGVGLHEMPFFPVLKYGRVNVQYNSTNINQVDSLNVTIEYHDYEPHVQYASNGSEDFVQDAAEAMSRTVDGLGHNVEKTAKEMSALTYNPIHQGNIGEPMGPDDLPFQIVRGRVKGALLRLNEGPAMMLLSEHADPSTVIHELAHFFEPALTSREKRIVLEWAGEKDWNRKTSEKFAKGFELYMAEGKAPSPELQSIFDKFKSWLRDLIGDFLKYFAGMQLNDEMRALYGAMLGESILSGASTAEALNHYISTETNDPLLRELALAAIKRDSILVSQMQDSRSSDEPKMPDSPPLAPNGEPSILYNTLEKLFGPTRAYRTYLFTKTEDFQNWLSTFHDHAFDKNGEPAVRIDEKGNAYFERTDAPSHYDRMRIGVHPSQMVSPIAKRLWSKSNPSRRITRTLSRNETLLVLHEAIDSIVTNPKMKSVLKIVANASDTVIDFGRLIHSSFEINGTYSHGSRRIFIASNLPNKVMNYVLVHELLHKATVDALRSLRSDFARSIGALQIYTERLTGKTPDDYYGLFNEREFVAEAFSNSEFINLLDDIAIGKVEHIDPNTPAKAIPFINAMNVLAEKWDVPANEISSLLKLTIKTTEENIDFLIHKSFSTPSLEENDLELQHRSVGFKDDNLLNSSKALITFNDNEQSQYFADENRINISLHEVAEVAQMTNMSFADAFAYVLSHEIGHELFNHLTPEVEAKMREVYRQYLAYEKTNPYQGRININDRMKEVDENGNPTDDGFAEFLAESLGNPYFAAHLDSIKLTEGKTLLQKLIDLFLDLLGIKSNRTLLSETLRQYRKNIRKPANYKKLMSSTHRGIMKYKWIADGKVVELPVDTPVQKRIIYKTKNEVVKKLETVYDSADQLTDLTEIDIQGIAKKLMEETQFKFTERYIVDRYSATRAVIY